MRSFASAKVVVGMAAMGAVLFLFVKGAMWASENLLGPLILFGWLVFFFDLTVLLPLSLVRRLRPHTGAFIFLSSWVLGLVTCSFGFIITFSQWGRFAALLGLMFFGVGVVFTAIAALVSNGMWQPLANLVFLLALTFGTRIVGILIGKLTCPI